jgi:ATP-dependent RNA helicase DDX19/DBP5
MSFSITYDLKCMEFAEVLVPDPIIISLKKGEESLDNIQRYYVKCAGPQEKYNAITNIYGTLMDKL